MTHPVSSVLVVDDERLDLMMVERGFADTGDDISVETCLGSKNACEHIAKTDADLVLLDLNMPGLNGFELLAKVQAGGCKNTPVMVVLSTSESARDVREAYRLGAAAYVAKPTTKAGYGKLANAIRAFWAEHAIRPC